MRVTHGRWPGRTRSRLRWGAGETAITFIGHSSFLIQTAGRALLIDPVFATRLIVLRRQRRPGLRVADLPRIDAVLLTHAHMDHLNRPSLRAITREMRRRGLPAPVAIVPQGVEDLVADLGFAHVESLKWWQSTELKAALHAEPDREHLIPIEHGQIPPRPVWQESVTITATPARHWGARMFKDTHRGFGGYVIASKMRSDDLPLGGFGLFRRVRGDRAAVAAGDCAAADWRVFSG